jgi:hypothetical protein
MLTRGVPSALLKQMHQSTAEVTLSPSTARTFRVSRWLQNMMAAAGLALCGVLYLLSLRFQQRGGQLAIDQWVFWGAMGLVVGFDLVFLIFGWRHKLVLGDGRIASHGLLSSTEIRLDEVTELKWMPYGPGAVLTTNFEKVRIIFNRYPYEAGLPITEFLRHAVPAAMQDDWNQFCLKVALPLRTGRRRTEVLRPRGHFDRLCCAIVFAELAFAIADWRLAGPAGNWRSAAWTGLITLAVWITARSFIPRQCEIKVRPLPLGPIVELLADHLTIGVVNLGLIVLCVGLMWNVPIGLHITLAVIIVVGLGDLVRRQIKFWKAWSEDRRRDPERSEAAAREWDALTPSGCNVIA